MSHAAPSRFGVVATLVLCYAAAALAESPATAKPAPTFAGEWDTTYGPMTLAESKGTLSGSYGPASARATIEGTLDGPKFTFTYAEPNAKGEGVFELAANGQSFTGKWREAGAANWATWTGTRRAPPPLPFTGLWKTSYGRMRLRQTGDAVKGVYDFAGGSNIAGTVTGQTLKFTYAQPDGEKGEGTFELAADHNSFAGTWKGSKPAATPPAVGNPDAGNGGAPATKAPAGQPANSTWTGTRILPQPNRIWLVVLEANWEQNLEEDEYSFGLMLRTFFARAPHVKVRHRFFADEADFRRWAAELAYLAEPVVLHVSSHGDKDGIHTRGGQLLTAKTIAESLAHIGDLKLLHFGTCLVAGGDIPKQIHQQFADAGGPRFPISGYANFADWGGSAVIDFTYLDLILARHMPPADAFAQTRRMITFANDKPRPGDAIGPAGLVFIAP